MTVVLVDHGLCNTGSARRALEECGASVSVTDDPSSLSSATHVVLPGVGSFSAGMQQLRTLGWDVALQAAALDGLPILGICLGMQLLADVGFEGGETRGLGLIPGEVVRMMPAEGERLPHVGWNEVTARKPDALFDGIPGGTDFYFVHSFHFAAAAGDDRIATVPYAGGVVAAIRRDRVFGVQFHPEKSAKAGFQLLRNFLSQ
ncbi:Imidazole glycerol phosphate synthase amidotransferase subunit [Labilithrix luteola]|uniref:Imidazole glycerol phosphate synthase subunit HisH n=1 Tax=Labilithrix luteola TaxID=1391654 RepID=A0A0K1Q6X0_9BACT|nr:imidazole glycerol phosphate synthase subunit HisH [Labilithrix luteola]AKV01150.1 Imidazole glycerol phosphate synthase amidotransferase subunit [Labilithrix luteola]